MAIQTTPPDEGLRPEALRSGPVDLGLAAREVLKPIPLPAPVQIPQITPQAITQVAQDGVQIAGFSLLRINTPDTSIQDQFTNKLGSPPDADEPDGFSSLGTPIYSLIVLGSTDEPLNRYTDAQGREQSYYTVNLTCATIRVDFNPQVVVTNIQGLPYSIKEFISSGDVTITIEGIATSTPGVSPKDFILNLNRIFNSGVPIPVTNRYLNDMGITYLVMMPGCSMWQEQGGYAYQKYTLVAISDTPMTEMLP